MIGALAGDIIGSIYEASPIKSKDFSLFGPGCRFTDDSVLTIAVARAILSGQSYAASVWKFGNDYPGAGYGGAFMRWLNSGDPKPYNSWGNGAAMRVSPVGFAFDSEEKVLSEAKRTAEISHNHEEGIKGAQATALAVFLARTWRDKERIRCRLADQFGYDLNRSVADIRPAYGFDISCQGTVPEAIIAFLDGDSYEDSIRNAISLGGDSDTLACITGGIAEAFYGPVAVQIRQQVQACLTKELWAITEDFCRKYM